MIPFVYVILLLLLLIVLYISGASLKKNYKLSSVASLLSIFIFTFVEGLRFGRGVDYNYYGNRYLDVLQGHEFEKSFVYNYVYELLIFFDLPYEVLVILMSFTFILALLIFLKRYSEIVPLALPLFVFFSIYETENMVRWYFAYSFFLIGLTDLLKNESLSLRFLLFSLIACSIHYAFIPVPVLFYILYRIKKPLFHPYISILIFLGIYVSFKTEFMETFVDVIKAATFVSESAYSGYVDKADYWLTGGFNGEEKSGGMNKVFMAFLMLIVFFGYKTVKNNRLYVYAYNCFLIGLWFFPLSKIIELVGRYDCTFYFFIAIVLSSIIYNLSKVICKKYIVVVYSIFTLCFIFSFRGRVMAPFYGSEKLYMFVWDHTNETYDYMMNVWVEANHNSNENKK